MLKVLQINSVCGVGSTGRIATDLYDILKQQGHNCKIAYGRGEAKNIPLEDTIKIGTDFDVKLHGVLTRFTDRTGFYSTGATKKLIEQIKEYNPDVIHLHNIHGYYINIKLLFEYLKQRNKPVVWTLHDCWSFTGHCAYFDFVGCDRWQTGCQQCPQKSSYPTSLFLDGSKQNYKKKQVLFTGLPNLTIVTPSQWLGDLVKRSFLKEYPVQVIHNGIDLSQFRPTESDFRKKHNLQNHKIILGVASVWEKRKGLEDFIVLSTLLDEQYKIVLVGLTEKQVEKLPPNMIGFTRTNSIKELAELYSTADVFVNPTYEDNFPTTNLEALACGTPVVTYQTGGSPECLIDACGATVLQGDLKQLYDTIVKMVLSKVSENDCSKHRLNFDKRKRYADYIRIYQRRNEV